MREDKISVDRDLYTAARAAAAEWSKLLLAPEEQPADVDRLLDVVARTFAHQYLPAERFELPGSPRALCVMDLDGDGDEELLVSSQEGEVVCLDRGADKRWWVAARASVGSGTGPVVGIEAGSPGSAEMVFARLILGPASEGGKDRFFTLSMESMDSPECLKLSEISSHGPRGHRLAVGARAGELAMDGMVAVAAASGSDGPELRVTLPLGQVHRHALHFRPTCLVHTSHRVWVADRQERVWCWRWAQGELLRDEEWPEDGLSIDGRVTALALWRQAVEDRWLLLAATDERFLGVVDPQGRILSRIRASTVVTGLAPLPAEGLLAIALEDGYLELHRPLRSLLHADPVPTLRDVLSRLDPARRQRVLDEWLESDEPDRLGAAVQYVLELEDPEGQLLEDKLVRPDEAPRSPEAISSALSVLEAKALDAGSGGEPVVELCLRLSRSLYSRCHLRLRARIDQITARLAARFGPFRDNEDYRQLDRARRRSDFEHAKEYHARGQASNGLDQLQAALSLYAEMLVHRRESDWVFATRRGIRALKTLPDSAHALVASREGVLYELDLERRAIRPAEKLPEGAIPKTIAVERWIASDEPSVAVVTVQGDLLLGPAAPGSFLGQLDRVFKADHEVSSLALIPAPAGGRKRLVMGTEGGSLVYYELADGGWTEYRRSHLTAEGLHSLVVDNLGPRESPSIIAGGQLASGGGILYLLDLEGEQQGAPMRFPGPVLDIRTVKKLDQADKLVAVACADGYLYLQEVNGRCRWRYRLGRAARSLAVLDVDEDGQDEVIVGGEADGPAIVVLNLSGTVRWIIPAAAPVTHVAPAVDRTRDRHVRPQLLIADLQHTLQIVEVNPPEGWREEEIRRQASDCLESLASGRTSSDGLLAGWLVSAPTPFLRAYAFLRHVDKVLAGEEPALEELLAVDPRSGDPIVRRAYARSLTDLATRTHDAATVDAVVGRLQDLFRGEAERSDMVAAALGLLKQRGRLNQQRFKKWLPVLRFAADHRQAEVRRGALNALRTALRGSVRLTLDRDAWTILRTAVGGRCDHPTWICEEAACLLRDRAKTWEDLWQLAHRALEELASPSLLVALAQAEPPLLEDPHMVQALAELVRLGEVCELEAATDVVHKLTGELDQVPREGDRSRRPELAEAYRLIGVAVRVRESGDWERFVTDRDPQGGLGRLIELLATTDEATERMIDTLESVRNEISKLLGGNGDAGSLRHLISQLNRHAERLLNPPHRAGCLPLSKALGGWLWGWSRPPGVLHRWLDDKTRPAEPVLEVAAAVFRRDRLCLEVDLLNPDPSNVIEEVNVFVDRARIEWGSRQLVCVPDPGSRVEDLRLTEQGRHRIRLEVPIDGALVRRLSKESKSATLSLPIHFFQPPRDFPRKTLTDDFFVRFQAEGSLDWEGDLPRSWRSLKEELKQALGDPKHRPVLIDCAPLARDSLLAAISRMTEGTLRPVVTDPSPWLAQLYQEQGRAPLEEATFLAWFAQQVWGEKHDTILTSGAPRHAFREMARAHRAPNVVILKDMERLLVHAGRKNEWPALEAGLPFLIDWARQVGIRIVFVGSHLVEQILARRWPALAEKCLRVRCDQLGIAESEVRRELVSALERLLGRRKLDGVLKQLSGVRGAADLVRLCGGYLHVLEFVVLPALERLRESKVDGDVDGPKLLLDFATESNFFNAFWLWQDFFERLATVLVSHGEILLEDRSWAEPGFVLSRDYYSRRPNGRKVPRPTLAAGVRLGDQQVQVIRANKYYQSGDACVRGFSLQRPLPADWARAGELFTRLLRAAGGNRLLDELERGRVVSRRQNRHFGVFYEMVVPLHGQWLRSWGILKHMIGAAEEAGRPSWYPPELAIDQRKTHRGARQLLFAGRHAGNASRDLPLSEKLAAVDHALDPSQKSLFFNFYGLGPSADESAAQRWRAMVRFANALGAWSKTSSAEVPEHEVARGFFAALKVLLKIRLIDPPRHGLRDPDSSRAPFRLGGDPDFLSVPWTYAELAGRTTLRKTVLIVVLYDGAGAARSAGELRNLARDRLIELLRSQQTGSDEIDEQEALERSIVLVLTLTGEATFRRAVRDIRGRPHFVVLSAETLTRIVIHPDPGGALINRAFEVTGRHPFTPYQLAGNLPPGSNLFVGRQRELQSILSLVEQQDQVILGSRRIGKTSLLREIEYRLQQRGILTLQINLRDTSTIEDFYTQLRWGLEDRGHKDLAASLSSEPGTEYSDLRSAMQSLKRHYNHPVVVLMDEVDGLYLRDRRTNRERFFQFLRNNLAQATPRICTFIMTGYRQIFFHRLVSDSVFHNFGRFQNLFGVEREAVGDLVRFLAEDFNIEIGDEPEVLRLIESETHAIPYYVQRVCDDLLRKMDREKKDTIDPGDVQAIVDRDLKQLLKRELWDNLNVDPLLVAASGAGEEDSRVQHLKIKCLLLATIINLYQIESDVSKRTFNAVQATECLGELAPESLLELWSPSEGEAERLLNAVTMTLALSPADEDLWAYTFPNDILPRVLQSHEDKGRIDSLAELGSLIENLTEELGPERGSR